MVQIPNTFLVNFICITIIIINYFCMEIKMILKGIWVNDNSGKIYYLKNSE